MKTSNIAKGLVSIILVGGIYLQNSIAQDKKDILNQTEYHSTDCSCPRHSIEIQQKTPQYHAVKKGDTYYSISDLYWDTPQLAGTIQDLNPGIDPNKLKIGQKIKLK